jgi:hypothetical protein
MSASETVLNNELKSYAWSDSQQTVTTTTIRKSGKAIEEGLQKESLTRSLFPDDNFFSKLSHYRL